jgi:hypothetical protein
MSVGRREIVKAVSKQFDQEAMDNGYEGPVRAGSYIVHRVWTEWGENDDWDCQAHYVVEAGPQLMFFHDFSDFGAWLSTEFDQDRRVEVRESGLDKVAARRERFIKTLVASVIVIGAFAVFAYTTIQNPGAAPIGYIATAVIGGGAGLLFGNWSRGSTPPPS